MSSTIWRVPRSYHLSTTSPLYPGLSYYTPAPQTSVITNASIGGTVSLLLLAAMILAVLQILKVLYASANLQHLYYHFRHVARLNPSDISNYRHSDIFQQSTL